MNYKLISFKDTFTNQRANYEEKLPDLTPVQRGELAAQKGDSWVEVEIFQISSSRKVILLRQPL